MRDHRWSFWLAVLAMYAMGLGVGLMLEDLRAWVDVAMILVVAGLVAWLISTAWAESIFDQLYQEEIREAEEKRRKESRTRCGNDDG
jgi:cytosine/uracil/thiamine/allantoin permease